MFPLGATFRAEKGKESLFVFLLGAHCYLKSLLKLPAEISIKGCRPELTWKNK